MPTTAETLRIYKETSLTGIVRDEITRLIEAGELLPGAWVNEAELARRRQGWQKPAIRVQRGVLAKYARTVGSASQGAVTN